MSRKKQRKAASAKPSAEGGFLTIRLALGVALAISAFLLGQALLAGGLPGCGPDSGCDRVLSSRWARLFGVPVSAGALVVYGWLLGETFRKTLRWPLISALALVGIGSILWFTFLQAAVLNAFCGYCLASHLAGFAGSFLLLLRSVVRLLNPILASVGALSVFVLAQVLAPAPAPRQVNLGGGGTSAEPEIFSILGGQHRLDLSQVPVIGNPAGPNKVVKLFDYTCHHCRDLHHLLHEYRRTNELTVIALPVPLDPECNSIMTRTHPDHLNACEYARIGLAVHFANPEKFEAFSDWLFEPVRPHPLTEVRAYASSLVGSNAFQTAFRDARVDAQIATDVAIYRANSQLARSGQMPQMIFQNTASIGAVPDQAQLRRIMSANLPR